MTHPSPAEKPSELCPPLIDLYPDGRIPEAKGPIAECCGTVLMSDKRYEEVRSQLSRLAGELAVLDYIRANCKVIAWPGKGAYPIEHNPAASKDSWGDIVHLASLTPTPPAKEQP